MTLPADIGVIGDGRLAIALAQLAAAAGNGVWLYAPTPQNRSGLASARSLRAVVPEIETLHEGVSLPDRLTELAKHCRLIFFTGDGGSTELLRRMGDAFDGAHQICHADHQLVGESLLTSSDRIREWTPCLQIGAMAGPLHVGELLAGKPNACVVGSPFPSLLRGVQRALAAPHVRIYTTRDLVGVELSAALAQIVALAVGICDAMEAGEATRSTLIVRGLAELTRLGERFGAQSDTFDGLAGLARLLDLSRHESPDHDLGKLVAQGVTGPALEERAPAGAQSLGLIPVVRRYAAERGIRMPITATLDEILAGRITPGQVLEILMGPESRGSGSGGA